jgi:uncharacterized protein YbjT (DUF2867 family)
MTNNKTILVTGGTGNQGGAVAKNLSAQGFPVKVLTRNPDSIKAKNLSKINIQLVKGDLNSVDTYRQFLKDVYGIFSVQTFENGVGKEISQGIELATIAKEFGVKHFLYSSVAGANLNSGVPHIESKFKIENHIKQVGLPFTIIRPTSFYENFLIPQVKSGLLKGKLIQPVNENTILQYIASDNIGTAAIKIFENPEKFLGKTVPLAAEQLSSHEVAELFSEVLNKRIRYKKLPSLITRIFIGKSVYKMFKWMDKENRFLMEDVNLTRSEFSNIISLKTWIETNFPSKKK